MNTTVQEISLAIKQCGTLTISELAAKTGLDPWEVTSTLLKMFIAGLADRDSSGSWLVIGGGMRL